MLASTAAAAPSFLGGYFLYQASILRATYFLQASSSTSSSLSVHGCHVEEVKPGINHGILSLPEGRHSEEASQVGD